MRSCSFLRGACCSGLSAYLAKNKTWASDMKQKHPNFFTELAKGQSPKMLWIGCSDSRCPESQLLNVEPGEVFVHRNIANCVHPTDMSVMAVLQYAVEALKVPNIVVCGHYNCGGVANAFHHDHSVSMIDNWVVGIKNVFESHREELEALRKRDVKLALRKLCDYNAVEQTLNVCRTTCVQKAWKEGQPLAVHTWMFDLEDGLLHELKSGITSTSEISEIYRMPVGGAHHH